MTPRFGVAVIGAGYWGTKLIGEYLSAQQNKGNVRLAKVCDVSLTRLLMCEKTYSLHYGMLKQNFDDLLENRKITAVHIATPNHTHYALAKMALEAGKHVLIEKPMTLNSIEARELVELAASRELVLHVGHIFRFNSALQAARQVLQAGWIGKVFYARIQWTDLSQVFSDRDILFDLGPHPLDVLNLLLDAWPSQVNGYAKAYRNAKDQEEVAYVIAEFQNGVFAHIELSWLHPSKVREVTVVGSEGTLVVDCLKQHVVRSSNGNQYELPVSANNTIASEIEHFIDCIARKDVSSISGNIGVRTVEILETIRKSMRERPIPIAQPIDHTAILISVLEKATNGSIQSSVSKQTGDEDTFAKYTGMLVRSGFLRTASTREGMTYEITESGLKFLAECRDMQSGVTRGRIRISEPS